MKKSINAVFIIVFSISIFTTGCSNADIVENQTVSYNSVEPTSSAENEEQQADSVESDISDDSTTSSLSFIENIISKELEIPQLNGSILIPENYYAFSADIPYTEQMCRDIGVEPQNMEAGISLLEGQTLIVPSDIPYQDSAKIYIKVKEKKYDDITLSELSQEEYDLLVSTIVRSFKSSKYDTVEGNGLKFFVFSENRGMGNICRYATILNGHMVYVYENTGAISISEEQKAILEFIALSIKHGL